MSNFSRERIIVLPPSKMDKVKEFYWNYQPEIDVFQAVAFIMICSYALIAFLDVYV